jgi:micrococcal nuclease
MKTRVLLVLSCILALSACARTNCFTLLATQISKETPAPSQQVIFHGCHDGDTCTFTLPAVPPPFGNQIPIRLAGVDTPEMHGKCDRENLLARQAQAFTQGLLSAAKQVELVDMRRDKYFRVLAGIRVDGRDVAQQLIKAGLGVPYNGGTKTANWCIN